MTTTSSAMGEAGARVLPSPTKAAGLATIVVDEREVETPKPPKMAHDSMVTVRLSEPPTLKLDTKTASRVRIHADRLAASTTDADDAGKDGNRTSQDATHRQSAAAVPSAQANRSLQDELGECGGDGDETDSTDDADEEVNWEQLEKTEDEQVKDDETDNSTALLLARLEQENAKLATNPKSVKVQTVEKRATGKPRPPSMAQLRQMVHGPTPAALRYSMLPPPPMTDLEFFAALVKDYQQTAARLPTLLSNKIRKGIPPPLRGVVWQSMSGARDAALEERYERFCGESSPYELLIGKDLGRSFPGVDMFRDPDGDGQRMLGRVLKSFSLYDTKIGYCQGLAFLVGPLLMHMPDKQAFCVLVRLMERYDLRACFLPDLSGLHVRIYQFRELLRLNLPALSAHLDELQVETAYVSQWFLSFFAVTCPLPMLFRIYDVIFAEGASETLMRVALSLMRKNESRLLACTELEDVMQLLLSRGLWDCYHYNADEFVHDFVGLSAVVTRERLAQLEQGYRESLVATTNGARASDITTAAARFLGRIWASSAGVKNGTLTPGPSAPSRPMSMLRRSASKQSLASTLNSLEASSASSASVTSSTSTDATNLSCNAEEDSLSRESTPVGPKSLASTKPADDKYLHSQIEDLLTALSELQRNHSLLLNQLQLEREEREEGGKAVRSLLVGLRKRTATKNETTTTTMTTTTTEDASKAAGESVAAVDGADAPLATAPGTEESPSAEDISALLERVECCFRDERNVRRSSTLQSKTQLKDELVSVKGQLTSALSQNQELNRQVHATEQEMASLKEQLRERHNHVRTLHHDKQRLEKQIHTMRTSGSAGSASERPGRGTDADAVGKATGKATGKAVGGGLREFKLGRSKSIPPHPSELNKRMSSLPPSRDSAAPASSEQDEALLLELVRAKTAEATAQQEAEEAKQKLEALRKAYGLPQGEPSGPTGGAAAGVAAVAAGLTPSTAIGVLGRLAGHVSTPSSDQTVKSSGAASSAMTPAGGGFWGWRR
ncbi:hypothetical protein RJ55_08152 [Drechmeria coniospora]|nr:hypothetical protein RJ55_08152 [Drechmeria coniospora]